MDSFGKIPPIKIQKKRASISDICPPPLLPLTRADIQPRSENKRLGVVRDTMLQNHLILKPELGRAQRCTKLPGSGFVYGLPLHRRDGGVPEAIGSWNVIAPSLHEQKSKSKDFVVMHCKGLKHGLCRAKEHSLYRRFHEVYRNEDDAHRFRRDPPRLPDAMTYGRPYPPPTPMIDILQHKFGDLWVEEQEIAARILQEKHHLLKRRRKGYDTYNVMVRKHQMPLKLESLWHLPRFDKTVPHLSTFSTQEDRVNAFKAQQTEASVRCGDLARGIYTHV